MSGMKRIAAILILVGLVAAVLLRQREERREPAQAEGQWPVMGTFLSVRAYAEQPDSARAAVAAARAAVFRVDSLMSTWKPESEISRLNAAAGTGTWTSLSEETVAVLAAAHAVAAASEGAFDVTVGPLMHAWGFRGGARARPQPALLDSVRALVGMAALELDGAGGRARLTRAGAAVDLGAIAKGYALDLAAAGMRRAGAMAGLVDLGGNALAFGPPPGGRDAWVVGILDPRDPDGSIGEIRLREGAVATSGDYEQFFEADGVRYSHIMDPRTGAPAHGVLQATVVAPTGLQSDALSTALFLLGPERGRALLDHPLAEGAAVAWVLDSLPLDPRDIVVAGADTPRITIDMTAAAAGR